MAKPRIQQSFPLARAIDQYRTTTTMAAINNAAISDSARSLRFERGFAVSTSSGGMTQTLTVLAYAFKLRFRAGA